MTFITSLLLLLSPILTPAVFASSVSPRNEVKVGLEVNLLWALPPFKTYEIRVFAGVASSLEVSLGYGRQEWTYEGDSLTQGTMKSDALILGTRYYIDQSRVFIDYSAWVMKDRLLTPQSKLLEGPALSHEFFAGYRIGEGSAYFSPGMNLGFYSYRPYTEPVDDRYKITIVPKIVGGVEIK
jgi:hypothetical protein